MKKSIISPLCSALVVPGLGQIINGQIKKGVALCLSVLVLLILAVVETYFLVKASLKGLAINELYPEMVISKFKAQDHTVLWIIFAIFVCIWLYSIIDAFIVGRKIDLKTEPERLKNEILSH
jgi:TM2 domain-containing membrane protein YozV